jgi:hypothetical protein
MSGKSGPVLPDIGNIPFARDCAAASLGFSKRPIFDM